jgi:meso-butanediol dehydrogenase/(S,S)-butanediol dehydrogenase/diacetyl reductase
MTDRLRGKIAMITGGAGGIGSGTAKLFAAEGAQVAIVDLDREAVAETAKAVAGEVPGADILPVVADISSEAEAERAVAETVACFGGLTVLVNNAGVREFEALADASWDSWQRIIGVNLLGTANCSRAALGELRKADAAAMVNVSSVYGVVGRKGMGQYDATKAAILSMTRTLACEEAEHGIRVNAVCPGGTLTPYHLKRYAAQGIGEQELQERQKGVSLIGRWARVEEMAWPILWLASDEASFMTGAALMVDGGVSAM